MAEDGDENGQLLANLLHFGRLLRSAGLKISANQMAELVRALPLIDISSREDFYYTSRALLLNDPHDFPLFDQAFDLFWMGTGTWLLALGQTRHLQPAAEEQQTLDGEEPILKPTLDDRQPEQDPMDEEPVAESEAQTGALYSALELLRHKNFAEFTDQEKLLARRIMEEISWEFQVRQTRRLRRTQNRTRHLDLRRMVRANMHHGGEIMHLTWRRPKTRPRPLVVICDISGSMDRYSRLFLHFIHALNQDQRRVEAFAFGTRLTYLTPALRHNDVDTAVDKISHLVVDWAGGTRIGESLKTFNYHWSRRVLGWGATLIIISDGWERGNLDLLAKEMERLKGHVHRLIWLNPLAGSPGYQPLVQGIKTVLPYCDEFLPLHNLHSLEQVVSRLGAPSPVRRIGNPPY